MSKKLIAFALAGLFAFSAVSVKADTLSDLQAQITALLAQITALQAQIAGTGTGVVCFNTDLQKGMTSDDVKNLQIKLGVTPTSGYFGTITFAAVKTFQTAHGIINTGYVGPLTRTALNTLYCTPTTAYPAGCTSAVGFSTTTGLSCAGTTTVLPEGCTSTTGFSPTTGLSCAGTTTTTVGPSYGTLSVVTYPVSNPQTTLFGGTTYETVAGQYKATGSDITIKKVAVQITDANQTTFPWQAFTAISLWDGATKLAEVSVTQANLIEMVFAHDYVLNISGLNWVIPNGTQKVLTVKATTVSNAVAAVTFAGTGNTYAVTLLANGLVYNDTAGVTYTTATGANVAVAALRIAAGQASTITTTSAVDNPLAGNVIGSTSATTKIDVLKFNVKAADVNVTFNNGTIKVRTAAPILDAFVTSLELWDSSTLVAVAAPAGWVGNIGTSTWTNFSLPMTAGTTKTLTVKAVIAQLPALYAGNGTVDISTGPVLTGVDANSNVVQALGAAITGGIQHVFLTGPVFALTSASFTATGTDPTNGHTNDFGNASLIFSITATGLDDIYLKKLGNATGTAGMVANILRNGAASGLAAGSSSPAWTCNSPAVSATAAAEAADMWWRIPAAASVSCQFTDAITNTAGNAGTFQVNLATVTWSATAASSTTALDQAWGLTTLQTGLTYLGI